MTERYEEGKRIISLETKEEVLPPMTDHRVEVELPKEIVEAIAIDSAEEFGIAPDDLGFPPRPTIEAGGTDFR